MSYYNNYNKGEYSGGNRYQPYKKKEKGESSYWKSKGFTKERQEDRYNEDDVAEKIVNGTNHHLFHIEVSTGKFGDFNGEVDDIDRYKKAVIEALGEVGIVDVNEVAVHRGCKYERLHLRAIVAFRLKRDGKRHIDRERTIRILTRHLGRSDCDGCKEMRARGKRNECPSGCGWRMFSKWIKNTGHLSAMLSYLEKANVEFVTEQGGERELVNCPERGDPNHMRYQCDRCYEIDLRRKEEGEYSDGGECEEVEIGHAEVTV